MEFFTTSIAQRTRQRRLKFYGLDKVNDYGHGIKEMAPRSKRDSRKGHKKSVPGSMKYCDVVEIDTYQFKKDLRSSESSCDTKSYAHFSSPNSEIGLDHMDVEMDNSRSFTDKGGNQEPKLGEDYRLGRKGVASSSKKYSRKGIKKGVSGSKKHPIVIGTDEDVREFSNYDGKATKREEVIKTKSNHFNDLEVVETS